MLSAGVALVGIDLLQLFRPSALAAAACTTQLFSGPVSSGRVDAGAIVSQYRDTVAEQAALNDLPPELEVELGHKVFQQLGNV